VLVRSGQGCVLLDGLFGPEAAPFGVPAAAALGALHHARPPFDGVNVVIATHVHDDHFDAGAVASYLEASPHTHFVSTPQAVGSLIDAAGAAFAERVHAMPPQEGKRVAIDVNGVRVECFGLSHGKVNYADVEHNGVLVRLANRSILHLGDGIIDEKALRAAGVLDEDIDVGILPFWFLTYPFGKRLMQRALRPRATFAVHIRVNEREQVVKEIEAAGNATPLIEPLSRYSVADDGHITREE
jgi:L-ascorbate metabolism protein UlaG (beta-lactamase superfamily)